MDEDDIDDELEDVDWREEELGISETDEDDDDDDDDDEEDGVLNNLCCSHNLYESDVVSSRVRFVDDVGIELME